MKDFLGNEINKRDFIVLDSYTTGGHHMRVGIVYNIDEDKGKLYYILRYGNATMPAYYNLKHTTVMDRVLRVHPDTVPNDIAAGLWAEVTKLV